MEAKKHKTATKLTLLLITFVLPVLVSWVLFYYHQFFHFKTTNHGSLITPAIQFTQFRKDKPTSRAWQILYVPASCEDKTCEKTLYVLSQLKKGLGKDYNRVDLLLLSPVKMQEKYLFRQMTLSKYDYSNLEQKFQNTIAKNTSLGNKIYLMDPDENLMMFYESQVNAMDILKDIKHLLGVSQIG